MKKLLDQAPRFLFFTGKGGVGKTSMSCVVASKLAERGKKVLLISTDPASNLDEVLETELHNAPVAIDAVPGLWAMNIDPVEAAAAYRERIVGPFRGVLPDEAVRSVEEQLSGACTVEIAAFNEFSQIIGGSEAATAYDHILLDTAPTGHTLLLLDATESYHREVLKNTSGFDDDVVNLLPRLRDPEFTKILIVTLPEATPVHEAKRLQADLWRAGIDPFGWVINQSFALSGARDPVLMARGYTEWKYIDEVKAISNGVVVISSWLMDEMDDATRLRALWQTTNPRQREGAENEV